MMQWPMWPVLRRRRRDFHHDDTVFVTHDAVNGESRQVFKKVLRNGATGVFQGKILVKAGRAKDRRLSDQPVACCWMTTASFLPSQSLRFTPMTWPVRMAPPPVRLTKTALFYLRSRGVSDDEARNLLTLAFLAEALEEIEDEALAEDIARPAGRLAGAAPADAGHDTTYRADLAQAARR